MVAILVVLSSCSKSGIGNLPDDIVYLNQPHLVKVSGDPAILDTDPSSFEAKISVDLFFKNSDKPDYLELVVVKNGDREGAKVLQSQIKTFPLEIEVTGQQLIDLFGVIVSGDNFDFGANYVTGNKTYLAFPTGGGASYGSGILNQEGASPLIRYSAICGFDVPLLEMGSLKSLLMDGRILVLEEPQK